MGIRDTVGDRVVSSCSNFRCLEQYIVPLRVDWIDWILPVVNIGRPVHLVLSPGGRLVFMPRQFKYEARLYPPTILGCEKTPMSRGEAKTKIRTPSSAFLTLNRRS